MNGSTARKHPAVARVGRWAGALLLVGAGAGAAQSVGECSSGMPAFGSLGIGEFRCVGGTCAVNMRNGDPYSHSFSTEPRLTQIERAGPGRNVLEDGDVLVAIDGTLITTAEGGRRLGSVSPGQDVQLTLRRDGREISARLTAESSCDLPGLTVTRGSGWDAGQSFGYTLSMGDSTFSNAWVLADSVSGFVYATPSTAWTSTGDSLTWARPLYTLADSAGASFGLATTAPFVVSNGQGFTLDQTYPYGVLSRGARPPVEFGLELSCGECGWRGSGLGATFATDVFPLIESVEKDGPADRAGILPGDVMFSVGGAPITSRSAGGTLGALEPGDSIMLEVRRGDRILEITITAREATGRRQRM